MRPAVGSPAKPCRPPGLPYRTFAEINLRHIRLNLHALNQYSKSKHSTWHGLVPMVKCNAYGHGLEKVSRTLAEQQETVAFGVASVEEALALRHAGTTLPIWIFSDCSPWTPLLSQACSKYWLTPILHCFEDLRRMLEWFSTKAIPHPFQLKFNTGMNRFGMTAQEAFSAAMLIKKHKQKLEGVCMHFASAEKPLSIHSQYQADRFLYVVSQFWHFGLSYIHSSNTAALLHAHKLGLNKVCNVGRPGLGIYGYCGDQANTHHGKLQLKPALQWKARVIEYRNLKRGEHIGYGASHTVLQPTPMVVLGAGYGDGLKRSLSNKKTIINNRTTQILGRVSMDATAFHLRIDPAVYHRHYNGKQHGIWYTLLGENSKQGAQMALQADTNIYEILTSLSSRVPRLYLGN